MGHTPGGGVIINRHTQANPQCLTIGNKACKDVRQAMAATPSRSTGPFLASNRKISFLISLHLFFFFSFSSHYLGVYFHFPPVLELLAQHLAQGN